MSDQMLLEPVELTNAELDMVTGGLAIASGGLVNVPINLSNTDITVLSNHGIDIGQVVGDITVSNIANANHVAVGAVIQALGGGAAVLQRA